MPNAYLQRRDVTSPRSNNPALLCVDLRADDARFHNRIAILIRLSPGTPRIVRYRDLFSLSLSFSLVF